MQDPKHAFLWNEGNGEIKMMIVESAVMLVYDVDVGSGYVDVLSSSAPRPDQLVRCLRRSGQHPLASVPLDMPQVYVPTDGDNAGYELCTMDGNGLGVQVFPTRGIEYPGVMPPLYSVTGAAVLWGDGEAHAAAHGEAHGEAVVGGAIRGRYDMHQFTLADVDLADVDPEDVTHGQHLFHDSFLATLCGPDRRPDLVLRTVTAEVLAQKAARKAALAAEAAGGMRDTLVKWASTKHGASRMVNAAYACDVDVQVDEKPRAGGTRQRTDRTFTYGGKKHRSFAALFKHMTDDDIVKFHGHVEYWIRQDDA